MLAVLTPPAAASQAAPTAQSPPDLLPDVKTEEGLRKALDPIEARYESACVRMNEARWRLVTSPDDAGGEGLRGLETARSELAAVFADSALDRVLAIWTRRTTVTRDPGLTRRVNLWVRSRAAAAIELQPAIFSLTNDLAGRVAHHRFSFDGRELTLQELRRVVASHPDRETRRKAWMAEAQFAAELRPDAAKLIRMRALEAQRTDARYFHRLIFQGRSVDDYWSYAMMQQAAARTKQGYETLAASLRSEAGLETLEPWDLEYALSQRTKHRAPGGGLDAAISAAFPAGGALAAAGRLLKALGFEAEKIPQRTSELRLGFSPAFSMAIRIPTDERLVVDAPAAEGGPRAYESVLREQGRVLLAAFNRQQSPMLKGYDCVTGTSNGVYAAGLAGALGDFVRDPVFLRDQLGMDGKWIDRFLEDEQDRSLVRMRTLLADLGFAFASSVNPDADIDARYRELNARSLGTTGGPEGTALWPAQLDVIQRPGAALDELIGLTISPEVHARLTEEFGDGRLRSGKAASWLIEHCYANGELVDLQERLQQSLHGGMNLDKYLTAPSKPDGKAARP